MSIGYLILSILLFTSVIMLIKSLSKGKKTVAELSSAFDSEANHLSCILVFFCTTYLLRFISDFWIIPSLSQYEDLVPCNLGYDTLCVNTTFVLYYQWTSLVFDFAPLSVIIYFHHKSFKNDFRT